MFLNAIFELIIVLGSTVLGYVFVSDFIKYRKAKEQDRNKLSVTDNSLSVTDNSIIEETKVTRMNKKAKEIVVYDKEEILSDVEKQWLGEDISTEPVEIKDYREALENCTVKELLLLIKGKNLTHYSNKRKSQLIDMLVKNF